MMMKAVEVGRFRVILSGRNGWYLFDIGVRGICLFTFRFCRGKFPRLAYYVWRGRLVAR